MTLGGIPHTFLMDQEFAGRLYIFVRYLRQPRATIANLHAHKKKLCYPHTESSWFSFWFEQLRTLACKIVHSSCRNGCYFVPVAGSSTAMGTFLACSLIWSQTTEQLAWCAGTEVLSKNYDYLANPCGPDSPNSFNTHFKLMCITNFKCSRAIRRGISKTPTVFVVWTEIKFGAITTMWSIKMLVGCVCQWKCQIHFLYIKGGWKPTLWFCFLINYLCQRHHSPNTLVLLGTCRSRPPWYASLYPIIMHVVSPSRCGNRHPRGKF